MESFLSWIRTHDESWLFVAMYIGFAVVLSVWLSLFWLVLMVGIHFAFELFRQSRVFERPVAVVSMASWEVRVDIALLLLAFAVSLYMDLIMAILGLQSLGRAAVATSRVGTRAVAWQRAVRAVVLGFDDVANAIRAIFMRKGGAAAAAGIGVEGPDPTAGGTEPRGEERGVEPAAQMDSTTSGEEGMGEPAGAQMSPGPDREVSPEAEDLGTPGSPSPDRGADDGEHRKAAAIEAGAGDRSPRAPGWGDRWGFWDRFTMALSAACIVAMVAAPPLTDTTWREAAETLREELRPIPPPEEAGDDGETGGENDTGR